MFNFLAKTFVSENTSSRRGSLVSSPPADGIHVYIGKPPHARKAYISQNVLKCTPALQEHVVEGSTIINTDPIIFEIAMEYIEENSFMGKMRPVATSPLEKLVGSSDMMLKLVKAWQLGQMLELPEMQNKLIDTFSTCYCQFLETRVRMPLSSEPFQYLRNNLGHHTICEKFLIHFYAGLSRYGQAFSAEELEQLPNCIAEELQYQRVTLMTRPRGRDRIAQGYVGFRVSNHEHTLRFPLQTLPPFASRLTRPNTAPSRPDLFQSSSSMSSIPPKEPHQPPANVHGHRTRLSLPALPRTVKHLDRAIEHVLQPALLISTEHTPPAHSRSASGSAASARAPFRVVSPREERRRMQAEAGAESSDDESVYDLFTPPLELLNELDTPARTQEARRIESCPASESQHDAIDTLECHVTTREGR